MIREAELSAGSGGTLADLPAGVEARVADVSPAGGHDGRLRRMGLCPGRRVCVRRAGDPMIVAVLGTQVGLSRRLARLVAVETEGAAL